MKAIVEGFSDELTKEIMQSVDFYSKILLHEKVSIGTLVYIQPCQLPGGFQATTFLEDLKTYTIEIRDEPNDDPILQTLAHELVHVKQWVTKELVTVFDNSSPLGWMDYWRGRLWKPKRYEDSYLDSPWEIEALGREQTLYYRWLNYKKENL